MAIAKADRELVATLASRYILIHLARGQKDITFEEGVLFAQKLLEVVDRRRPPKERAKK